MMGTDTLKILHISYSFLHLNATKQLHGNPRCVILTTKYGILPVATQPSTSHSLLHFVVSLNRLLIRRRHTSLSAFPSRLLLLLLLRYRTIPPLLLRSSNIHLLASMRLILLPRGFVTGLVVHIVIRDPPVFAPVVGYSLVLVVVRFRVEGDDVPGVEEAGDVAESAEEDVDEAVGGADARFDPDGDRGEEDGEEAEEDVAAAHCSRYG